MAKQTPEEKRQDELIDELLKGYEGPDSFWGESGLFANLKKRIVERTLEAEMDDHLGYSKHDPKATTAATVVTAGAKRPAILLHNKRAIEDKKFILQNRKNSGKKQ